MFNFYLPVEIETYCYMLLYVVICWSMLVYVGICWYMLVYVGKCWYMLLCVGTIWYNRELINKFDGLSINLLFSF